MLELISTSDAHKEDTISHYNTHKAVHMTSKLQQCTKQNITSINKREKVGKYLLGKASVAIKKNLIFFFFAKKNTFFFNLFIYFLK